MRKIQIAFLLLFSISSFAQELNCVVQVNSNQITKTNQQIFKTLEKAISELVNNTKWSDLEFKRKERIECSMFIMVSSYNNDQFVATLQVQSSRPVYNAGYQTPVLNYNDKDFTFRYVEFENLFYDPNSFTSNLVAVISFYANYIIGLDQDTFSDAGGTPYFAIAQNIVSLSQGQGGKGWNQTDGNQNRYFLAADMLSNTFLPLRSAVYKYHRLGLDQMSENLKEGKLAVKNAIMSIDEVHKVRPNAFLTRIFFDSKAEEIQQIFSAGPESNAIELSNMLNKLSPMNSAKWTSVKI